MGGGVEAGREVGAHGVWGEGGTPLLGIEREREKERERERKGGTAE